MTENKRYDVIYEKEPRGQVVTDNGIPCTARTCCTRLNILEEENEQLNQEYLKLKHRHSLLHDVCLDAECERDSLKNDVNSLEKENVQLKAQLYCDDEEGVCNICKHHYLVKDDETELGYYNSRCKKGHYECARVSLKYCDDFELKGDMND